MKFPLVLKLLACLFLLTHQQQVIQSSRITGNKNFARGLNITIDGSENNVTGVNTTITGNLNFNKKGKQVEITGHSNMNEGSNVKIFGSLNRNKGTNVSVEGSTNQNIGNNNILKGNENNVSGNDNTVMNELPTDFKSFGGGLISSQFAELLQEAALKPSYKPKKQVRVFSKEAIKNTIVLAQNQPSKLTNSVPSSPIPESIAKTDPKNNQSTKTISLDEKPTLNQNLAVSTTSINPSPPIIPKVSITQIPLTQIPPPVATTTQIPSANKTSPIRLIKISSSFSLKRKPKFLLKVVPRFQATKPQPTKPQNHSS